MRMLSVVVALAFGGCVNNGALSTRTLNRINGAALIASTAMLACDWRQTRSMAEVGWVSDGLVKAERNPIMGASPTPQVVDAYFAGAALLNAVIWYVTPARWRSALPLAITGLQFKPVAVNVVETRTLCGY